MSDLTVGCLSFGALLLARGSTPRARVALECVDLLESFIWGEAERRKLSPEVGGSRSRFVTVTRQRVTDVTCLATNVHRGVLAR